MHLWHYISVVQCTVPLFFPFFCFYKRRMYVRLKGIFYSLFLSTINTKGKDIDQCRPQILMEEDRQDIKETGTVRGVDQHRKLNDPTEIGSKDFPGPVIRILPQQCQNVTEISVPYYYDSLRESLENIRFV